MSKKPAKKNSNTQNAAIRIIGGSWRSRKLPVTSADGLRPTTDKMRETLFNWLAPFIHDAKVLDLFAGTGALGLESLSRGAKQAHFIEVNKQAARQLEQNIATLKSKYANIHHISALDFLNNKPSPFDIVFIDPPFDQNLWPETLQKLNCGWLADNALLYIETPASYTLSLPNDNSHATVKWRTLKEKKIGQVKAMLIQANLNI